MLVAQSISTLLCVLCMAYSQEDTSWDPFAKHLPDCRQNYTTISKNTSKKGILCPMIRDEQGFLSEWIAYHEMHGFDHIMIFDHGSSDNYTLEIQPWLSSVYKQEDWPSILDPEELSAAMKKSTIYYQVIEIKVLLEAFCKQKAITWGYDYFVSLDLDEYLMPLRDNITAIDALDQFFEVTRRPLYQIGKFNFQQAPHTLEPVNLLTIEAYMSRMQWRGVMSYKRTVAPKMALRLKHNSYNSTVVSYFARCCHFHGCGRTTQYCNSIGNQLTALPKNYTKVDYIDILTIQHYSRSLEKFGLKAKTWQTSGSNDNVYHLKHFLDRNVGHFIDKRMLRYSCQLRQHLIDKTGQNPFLRSGDHWYRNEEFILPKKPRRGLDGLQHAPDHYFGYHTTLYQYYQSCVQCREPPRVSLQGLVIINYLLG